DSAPEEKDVSEAERHRRRDDGGHDQRPRLLPDQDAGSQEAVEQRGDGAEDEDAERPNRSVYVGRIVPREESQEEPTEEPQDGDRGEQEREGQHDRASFGEMAVRGRGAVL